MTYRCDLLVDNVSLMVHHAGVLQGAIDYYIVEKFQRLTKFKAYDEVTSLPPLISTKLF